MFRNIALVALLSAASIVGLGLAPGALAATYTQTGRYDIPTTPGISVVSSFGGVFIGGYTFAATNDKPLTVDIADASGGNVAFTVCQDFDGALCGGAGEPRLVGCGTTADLSKATVAFRADRPISVFVRAVDPACAGGVATSGTIKVTYYVPDEI